MRHSFLATLLLLSVLSLNAQRKENLSVAIFLWDNAELLDFSGPGEVFSASGFDVYTVSIDGKEITSQGFMRIKPQYSIKDAPSPDIVVFPGGGATAVAKNQELLDWVNKCTTEGVLMMSVCTGAFVLADAGLLRGKNITTHYGSIASLKERHPELTVLDNTRFVDNGNIITTAGISAGIDGALHLVSKIKGIDVATNTAKYMEYDKWKPEEGRIDSENEYIEQLRVQLLSPEKKIVTSAKMLTSNDAPYVGELKNLAFDFKGKGLLKEAGQVLEFTTQLYPHSAVSFQELIKINKELGKPVPSGEEVYVKLLKEGKITEASKLYDQDQKNFPGWIVFSENTINGLGYFNYMYKQNYVGAIQVFQLLTKAYPNAWNAFDSLGEAHKSAGNKNEAILNYRKSLELNPKNDNAKKMLEELEKKQ